MPTSHPVLERKQHSVTEMERKLKTCDCKGRRTCLLCERLLDKTPRNFFEEFQQLNSFVYCIHCNKIFKGWNTFESCSDHDDPSTGRDFPGIFVAEFLSNEESENIVDGVDNLLGWDASQSGRRKKNFGPKVNFKKRKLQLGKFEGFPVLTQFVRERLKEFQVLRDFQVVEECFLEYDITRGSHIEPHIDDAWIWGERIVTVNCIGDSVLTLTKHAPLYNEQYNLDLLGEYQDKLYCPLAPIVEDNVVVRIPMPAKSLLVMFGPPRYQFEHSVLREDITSKRVAVAYREFTIPYQKNGPKFSEAERFYELSESTLS